jgi:hypothetical protein
MTNGYLVLAVPIRDKKMIIWNFMEELWSKHMQATSNGQDPRFHLAEFRYIDVFEKYLPIVGIESSRTDSVILDALSGFEERGLYKIENNIVSLTEKGLHECRKSIHDWDLR